MSDKIRMDSHKLMFHPERVAAWRQGKLIYPIEMEIGLSGVCNHRCIFCAVDYMEYRPKFLDTDILLGNLKTLAKKGLRSIIFAGEGEPLLHKDAGLIFNQTKGLGIDVAISTNGVLLSKELSEMCLSSLSWIRFSISGASEAVYKSIHQAKQGDLGKVFQNLRDAVAIKKAKNLSTTLGVQLLLLPENKDEVLELAKIVKDIGVDYFTVKPFSQHPKSKTKLQVDYSESAQIGIQLKELETDTFKIYFRQKSIENLSQDKPYDQCHGLNFMTYIDAEGNIFPCIVFMGTEDFVYGNLYDKNVEEIWESERAIKIRKAFDQEFIRQKCRKTCRLDEINKYLHKLKNPDEHVNFI